MSRVNSYYILCGLFVVSLLIYLTVNISNISGSELKLDLILPNRVQSEEFVSSDLQKDDRNKKKVSNQDKNFLDDCHHVYLDGGTNIGIQVIYFALYSTDFVKR